MKHFKHLLKRIEELAVEVQRLENDLRHEKAITNPLNAKICEQRMEIELLNSIIEDQKQAIKKLNENN